MANSPIHNADFFESKLTPQYKQIEVRRWLVKFLDFLDEKYDGIMVLPFTLKDIEEFIDTQLDEPKEKEI